MQTNVATIFTKLLIQKDVHTLYEKISYMPKDISDKLITKSSLSKNKIFF